MRARLITECDTPKGGHVAYYELSEPIHKGSNSTDIIELMKYAYNQIDKSSLERVDAEDFLNPDNFRFVCISDAWDHKERLVFMAFPCIGTTTKFSRYAYNIAGRHTPLDKFNWTRRDYTATKPNEVYLRYLAKINGKSWEGLENT